MKFSLPVALATFATVVAAHKGGKDGKDCDALKDKIPDCATQCVNGAAAKYCEPGELDCSCVPETLEKIIKDSTDCVAAVCKDQGPVFPPLRNWCECKIGGSKPTKTTTKPTPTPTCAAEEDKIPSCAIGCLNEQALKLCGQGEIECGCKPDNMEKIIKGSEACIEDKCKDKPPAIPPFRNFCKCVNGPEHTTTTTTTSAKPTKTTTTSAKPTKSSTTKSKPTATSTPSSSASSGKPTSPGSSTTTGASNSTTKSETATSQPITLTTTIVTTTVCPITSCAPTVTGCKTGDMTTETVTLTTTWCPETETQVTPCPTDDVPGTVLPPYPTKTGGPGVPEVSQVPSGSAVQPQPPAVTGAASTQRNSGAVAGIIAAIAGIAYL